MWNCGYWDYDNKNFVGGKYVRYLIRDPKILGRFTVRPILQALEKKCCQKRAKYDIWTTPMGIFGIWPEIFFSTNFDIIVCKKHLRSKKNAKVVNILKFEKKKFVIVKKTIFLRKKKFFWKKKCGASSGGMREISVWKHFYKSQKPIWKHFWPQTTHLG